MEELARREAQESKRQEVATRQLEESKRRAKSVVDNEIEEDEQTQDEKGEDESGRVTARVVKVGFEAVVSGLKRQHRAMREASELLETRFHELNDNVSRIADALESIQRTQASVSHS